MQNDRPTCKICSGPAQPFFKDWRSFFICPVCFFIFTAETVGEEEQRKHFASQDVKEPDFWNHEAQKYIRFARQFVEPGNILDFGSGKGCLSEALKAMGFDVASFEPMMHGRFDRQAYPRQFNLVVANQVIEHMQDIVCEIRSILPVLEPGGLLFFSSLFTDHFIFDRNSPEYFRNWWYKDDPTHVSFYCFLTLDQVGKQTGLNIVGYGPNAVALMRA